MNQTDLTCTRFLFFLLVRISVSLNLAMFKLLMSIWNSSHLWLYFLTLKNLLLWWIFVQHKYLRRVATCEFAHYGQNIYVYCIYFWRQTSPGVPLKEILLSSLMFKESILTWASTLHLFYLTSFTALRYVKKGSRLSICHTPEKQSIKHFLWKPVK